MSKVIGIDVSKATFDVAFCENDHWFYQSQRNDQKGFKALTKHLEIGDHCIMEASGPYYLQLAIFLHKQGIKVSVVNPLVIKRFAQMRLLRAKTDKKDAQTIAEYGRIEQPKTWSISDIQILKMQQIMSVLEGINKQKTMLSNQLGAFISSGIVDRQVRASLRSLLRSLDRQQQKLEQQLQEYIDCDYAETSRLLKSIPGIGKKAATMLIVLTHNFSKFSHYKELIAYVGFSPRIYQSGTSVKGKGHICKMGKSQMRKILYLCSWTAKDYNKACSQMYERLKLAGKPERVIKIAIANKLLKQAFAIANSRSMYEENYYKTPCF